MRLIVERNRRVEWEITRVVEEITLETIKRRVKVGKESFKEPTIRVEDTVKALNKKEVEPTLTVVNK